MEPDLPDIKECMAGNCQSFERLVRRYQHRAVSVAYQMLGDWEDAREAAQDAFVKVYQALHTFDVSKKFSTWMYRILINTCIDYRRRREVVTETLGITPLSLFARDDHTPDQDVEASEHRVILARALNRLSPKHRAVITLRDLQGLSSREVSDIMECSEATVRVHLFNARRQLKKALRPFLEPIS
jgi:RNA polymerase sigma-70 factor (ECF subfamily)